MKHSLFLLLPLIILLSASHPVSAQPLVSPDRTEGQGPFDRLIIRGVTLINGNGAPPIGPVDIVVEQNRIASVNVVGFPGVDINENRRPEANDSDHILDAEGMYLLPGFVDMHGHIGGNSQGTTAEYVFKLWMAHGITTVREPGSFNGLEWTLDHKRRSLANTITAPRIHAYHVFGSGGESIQNSDQARSWVRELYDKGADGIKFFGLRPDIMESALNEANRLGLGSATHHAQMNVAWLNARHTSEMKLTTLEHWYGIPEALFEDRTIQDYRPDYNYQDESHRFGEAGKLWKQAAEPHSNHWNAVMSELIERDLTLVPTFNIYDANRDFMRARRAEWHDDYTLPSLWRFYTPDRRAHGSYWFDWTTNDEILWKENYKLWMEFVNEYKNRGGRVTTGSDSGYIYQLYGFGFIRELELLQEAGFHPLEVVRAATLKGAEALGISNEIGTVEAGKFADFVLVEENPLENFKVLYGTGAIRVNDENEVVRVGGVKYTIKDGIIYDARRLLADVEEMVREAKIVEDFEIRQPGIKIKD